jgi:hypothetical protein
MDPITATLAANVVAVLAPYVAVGAQEFVRNAGKDAYEKAKTMLASLRAKWTGDEEATDALTRFEEKPERYAPVLEDVLNEKLAEDKELAMVLSTLLNEMGPSLEVVQKMEEGRGPRDRGDGRGQRYGKARHRDGRGRDGSEDPPHRSSKVEHRAT